MVDTDMTQEELEQARQSAEDRLRHEASADAKRAEAVDRQLKEALETIATMSPAWVRLLSIAEKQGRSMGGVLDDAECLRELVKWRAGTQPRTMTDMALRHVRDLLPTDGTTGRLAGMLFGHISALEAEHAKAIVRARNEGLEKAASLAVGQATEWRHARKDDDTREGQVVHDALQSLAIDVRAMKEPEP